MSELRFITAEAVQTDRAEITNKGKRRTVFLPDKLRRLLKKYLQGQKKTAGAVFTTRTGKPLDRSNIWRDMKALCESAGVEPGKVFPTICATCSPAPTIPSKKTSPGWRTFWVTPLSTPPASTPWRAAASICCQMERMGLVTHSFRSVVEGMKKGHNRLSVLL